MLATECSKSAGPHCSLNPKTIGPEITNALTEMRERRASKLAMHRHITELGYTGAYSSLIRHLDHTGTIQATPAPSRHEMLSRLFDAIVEGVIPATVDDALKVLDRLKWHQDAPARQDEPQHLFEQPTYVYVAYRDGRAIYVGMTANLKARMNDHAYSSPWWGVHHKLRWHKFKDRATAARVESALIAKLRPEFNSNGKRAAA